MRLIAYLVITVLCNMIMLLSASYFVPKGGFVIPYNFHDLAFAALVFSMLNWFIRPIVKIVLSPAILLTLGLAIFFINALMLHLLDKLSTGIIIEGIIPLLYATLIMSVTSLFLHLFAGRWFRQ